MEGGIYSAKALIIKALIRMWRNKFRPPFSKLIFSEYLAVITKFNSPRLPTANCRTADFHFRFRLLFL